MADFSKQWCEQNDPEMPHDFDIMEEYDKLKPGYMIPYICEGYGFLAIAKGHNGECLLGFDMEDDTIKWKTYEEVVGG